MRRPAFIARQASCPSGILGRLLGRIMAVETAAANDKALELLAIGPNDRVLEIGFGHGRTITRAAALASTGFVAGVEVSETMVRMATRQNRRLIAEGKVACTLLIATLFLTQIAASTVSLRSTPCIFGQSRWLTCKKSIE